MGSLIVTIEEDKESFAPGEPIRGTVRWEGFSKPGEVEIILTYRTEGSGVQDVDEIDSVVLPSSATSGSNSFSFRLPEGPYSFNGEYISLIWSIDALFETDDLAESAEFVLSPTGAVINLYESHQDS